MVIRQPFVVLMVVLAAALAAPAAFGTLAIYSHAPEEVVDIVGSGPGEVIEFDGHDAPAGEAAYRDLVSVFAGEIQPATQPGLGEPSTPVAGKPTESEARGQIAAGVRPARATDPDARDRFLVIERIARLSAAEQAKELPRFYRELAPRFMNPFVEGILSSAPSNILDRRAANGFDGNTAIWAEQLAEAASELSPEEVADKLKDGLWLNVAARACALQVLKAHAKATEALIQEDLKSGQKASVQRAANTILSLNLRTFTEQLLALFQAEDETSEPAGMALLFMRDPAIVQPLLARVEKGPKFLARCAGHLQGPLWRKPAEPLLLKLLDSPDAEVRYHAGRAVCECRDPKLAAPTVKFAQEKEPRFRIVAAYLASNLPADEFTAVRKDLVSLLNDPDEAVRFEALRCFAQQKDLAACPVILELLMRNHAGPAGQNEITVMQALVALTGQQFGYDMHNWGPGTPRNQQAIHQFQDWMETRGVPVPHTGR
ncbi:MAG: hypothetical protein NTX87_16770 [Planctomycetota bacterium]|nr:hypothetical protein [Planctomycetota bacterium]